MSTDGTSTRRAALIATTLAAFLTPFMDSAITVALPAISRELSLDAITLSWIRTAYLLAAAMFLVPLSKVADIHGRKKVFVVGMVVFSLAALLIGLSTSTLMLLATRFLQGIGAAMLFGTNVAILASVFPASQRGRVLGINVACVYLGLSLGPTIGGLITEQLGWRSIFFVTVALGVVAIAFVLGRLKGEWAEARGDRLDVSGSVLYSLSLVALMYGLSRLPGLAGAGLMAAGAIGLFLFVRWELRARTPVLNMRLLATNRPFALSNVAALINYSATSAVGFLLSLYLQYLKALTAQQAGLILVAQPAMQALFSPVAGRLSDRIQPRIVASAGMALTALGLILLILVGPTTPLWTVVVRLMLMGFGFALFSSPNMNAIMGSVDRRSYGVASGMLATMRLVGQMLGMGITTLLFALFIGRVQITPAAYGEFLTSMKTAFAIFASLCVGGIFASLARGKIRGEHEPD